LQLGTENNKQTIVLKHKKYGIVLEQKKDRLIAARARKRNLIDSVHFNTKEQI